MKIETTLKSRTGQIYKVIYDEGDPSLNMRDKILEGIHAYCFYGDKMVLVKHPRSGWVPPGGHTEVGESIEQTTIREVKEETNMKVLHYELIGFQDVYMPKGIFRQARTFCIVEPYGDFVKDPDGEIEENTLIDPKDYKKYFDWGEIGARVMERALDLLQRHS